MCGLSCSASLQSCLNGDEFWSDEQGILLTELLMRLIFTRLCSCVEVY